VSNRAVCGVEQTTLMSRSNGQRTKRKAAMNRLENVRRHMKVRETDNTITLAMEITVSKNNGWVQVNGTPMNAVGRPFFVSWAAVCRNVMQHLEVFAMDKLSELSVTVNPITLRYGSSIPFTVTWFNLGENGEMGSRNAPTFTAALELLNQGPPGWERYRIMQSDLFIERGDPHGPRGAPSPLRWGAQAPPNEWWDQEGEDL
jgi:hypothetical protein